ncbi:peptidoglycan D,D-transpeptidase FtsI family protein [Brevibacillus choshinensis]|uniref:Penicillin-binding protein n=1 Tax=Brevibacillus choshinensis TaxID=54911 RepID=A0ABX7FP44_BRECH|nr:penicillin-binding transpeptidase domain-containing protein [Brevibacillus choshinensis]QRG66760.1 penicillin-binding protein [Brevibacillus choshinensis]
MNEPTLPPERKKRINRLQVIYIMVFVLFAAIVLRLAQLQIQQGGQYASELMVRSFKRDSIPAMRGNIYDRTGHVIAQSRPSFLVVFREQESMDKEDYIRLLEKLVTILTQTDRSTLLKKMDVGYAYENGTYIRIPRQMPKYLEKELKSDLTQREIAELGENRGELQGIEVVTKPIRQYDPSQIAVQTVGYVRPYHIAENLDIRTYRAEKERYLPTQLVGLDGIELSYEDELRGINGYRLYEVAADQTVVKQMEKVLPVRGNDLTLTIDRRVQSAIRDSVRQFLPNLRATIPEAKYAKGAYVVAMEIKSGRIVAMVSYPEYDPNVWIEGPDQKLYEQIQFAVTNGTIREAPYDARPLTGEAAIAENDKHPRSIVPSGSVIKPITVLLGLQEGIIGPNDQWQDPGVYQYGRGSDRIKNDNGHVYGMLTPEKAIQKSSNTYMARIGEELSKRKGRASASLLQSYYHAFGLGIQTGVDLPNESTGKEDYLVMNENYGPLAAMVQASFGQQIRATAMQLAQYTATLANKGVRLQPQLVEKITSPDGKVIRPFTPRVLGTFPHPDAYWDILTRGMVMVTQPGGTAIRAFEGLPYSVAAKTGTSEQDIYVPVTTTDAKTGKKKTHWKRHARITNGVSISFAPVNRPKLAVAVVVPEGGYGGRSAAVITRAVYEAYEKYIGL